MICKALNPAPLTECEASYSKMVAFMTEKGAEARRKEGGQSSDEESEETLESMEIDSNQASSSGDASTNQSTRNSNHATPDQTPTTKKKDGVCVTGPPSEVIALGETGEYDPTFPRLAVEAAMKVLEYLEGMGERLLTACLHIEVSYTTAKVCVILLLGQLLCTCLPAPQWKV